MGSSMNNQEKADFFEDLCGRGIMLYPALTEDIGEHTYYARKIRTTQDEREYLSDDPIVGFVDRASAIEFIKAYIDWKGGDTEEETEDAEGSDQLQLVGFAATLMADFGFGCQQVDLGIITINVSDEDAQNALTKESEARAQKYIVDHHPDQDWFKLSKDIRVMPAAQPA